MPLKQLLAIGVLILFVVPVEAAGCTAKIRSGRAPFSHVRANTPISFWSYTVGTNGSYPQYGVHKSFVGDRQLMIPVNDLYDISPGCSSLPKYQ